MRSNQIHPSCAPTALSLDAVLPYLIEFLSQTQVSTFNTYYDGGDKVKPACFAPHPRDLQ